MSRPTVAVRRATRGYWAPLDVIVASRWLDGYSSTPSVRASRRRPGIAPTSGAADPFRYATGALREDPAHTPRMGSTTPLPSRLRFASPKRSDRLGEPRGGDDGVLSALRRLRSGIGPCGIRREPRGWRGAVASFGIVNGLAPARQPSGPRPGIRQVYGMALDKHRIPSARMP